MRLLALILCLCVLPWSALAAPQTEVLGDATVNPYERIDCGRKPLENSHTYYSNLDFGTGAKRMMLTYEAGNAGLLNGLEIRLDSIDGTLIGTIPVELTGWNIRKTAWITVDPAVVKGVHNLYVVANGTAVNLNYFQFSTHDAGEIVKDLLIVGDELVGAPQTGTETHSYTAYLLDDLEQQTACKTVAWTLDSDDPQITLADGVLSVGVPRARDTDVTLKAAVGDNTAEKEIHVYDGTVIELTGMAADEKNSTAQEAVSGVAFQGTDAYLVYRNVDLKNGIERYEVKASYPAAQNILSLHTGSQTGPVFSTVNISTGDWGNYLVTPQTVEAGTGPTGVQNIGLTQTDWLNFHWIRFYLPNEREPVTTYIVMVEQTENGTVTADKAQAAAGDTVTLTATPDHGYVLKSLKANGQDVEDGKFLMPAQDVTVTAEFEKLNIQISEGDIYVSTDGSDTEGNGSERKPYKTLPIAQLAVEAKVHEGLTEDLHVYLREGTYHVTDPVMITPQSCDDQFEIIYEPYQNEEVRVLGGIPVTGWTDSDGDGVYEADVTGYTDSFSMFADGQRLQNAKETNWQSKTVQDQSHLQAVHGSPTAWFGEVLKVTQNGSALTYEKGGAGRFSSGVWYLQGAREYIDEAGEWAIEGNTVYYKPLNGSAPESEVILAQTERIFYLKGTAENPVQNITIRGLDIEMNSFGRNLMAHGGRNNYNAAGQLISTSDVTREHADNLKGLVDLDNAQNITVKDCVLKNAGYMAVMLNHYSQNNTVYGNDIEDTGYAGIFLSGEDFGSTNHVNKNNTIENNRIQNVGKFVGNGAGIYLINSGNNEIVHNQISGVPRYGISMKGTRYGVFSGQKIPEVNVSFEEHFAYNMTTGNHIAYNLIHDTGMRSGDGGGVEGWGIGPDNVIENNIVYNAYCGVATTGWRGHSIFLDDATHYTTVRNNVVYDEVGGDKTPICVNASTMMKSISNIVVNNVFDIGYQIQGAANVGPYICPGEKSNFSYNIVYNNTPGSINGDGTWNESGNGDRVMINLDESRTNPILPEMTEGPIEFLSAMDHNLYFNTQGKTLFHVVDNDHPSSNGTYDNIDDWQAALAKAGVTHESGSAVADPKFVNAANRDYRLQADSPALAMGITSIASAGIGLNADFPFADEADAAETLFLVKSDTDGSRAAFLNKGEQLNLFAIVRTENGYRLDNPQGTTYSSSDLAVATVENGVVTAVSDGTATITAKNGSLEDVFVVQVGKVTYEIEAEDMSLSIGETDSKKISVTVKVQGGVAVTPDELTYQVENEAVAHVDASGTVTAVGVGTTKITITAMVNGTKLTKDIQVTVQFGLNEEDIQVTSQFGAVLLQWEKGADLDVTVTRMNPDGSSKVLTGADLGLGYYDADVEAGKTYTYQFVSEKGDLTSAPVEKTVTVGEAEVLFEDDFENGAKEGWVNASGEAIHETMTVKDGMWDVGATSAFVVPGADWKDYVVEMEVYFPGEIPTSGKSENLWDSVALRTHVQQDTKSHYVNYLRTTPGNQRLTPFTQPNNVHLMPDMQPVPLLAALEPDTIYTMRVEHCNGRYRAYMDNVLLIDQPEREGVCLNGGIGVSLENFKSGGYINEIRVLSNSSYVPSSEAELKSFAIDGIAGKIQGTQVTVTLPNGTDVTKLKPVIEVSEGATVSPAAGMETDFTDPVQYVVTAEDGTTQKTYTVTVRTEAPVVDKAELEVTVRTAKKLDASDYTASSWRKFASALEQAEQVLEDPNATQSEVNQATQSLKDAMDALKEKDDGTDRPDWNPGKPQTPVVPEPEFPFDDVAENAWYYESVYYAWDENLIDGVTADKYQPDGSLTVAQTIKLAAALHEKLNRGYVTLENGTANWYDTYVDYAVNNSIIEAKYQSYTKAQMDTAITRNEFVHIFHGAMDSYKAINDVADNAIPDVKLTDVYADEIYDFYRAGILTGSDGAGTFNGKTTIKRSEVATILVRMYDESLRENINL